MTAGREVIKDYRSKGLSLRADPVSFVRGSLSARLFGNRLHASASEQHIKRRDGDALCARGAMRKHNALLGAGEGDEEAAPGTAE